MKFKYNFCEVREERSGALEKNSLKLQEKLPKERRKLP